MCDLREVSIDIIHIKYVYTCICYLMPKKPTIYLSIAGTRK